jgi:hypothetical protein
MIYIWLNIVPIIVAALLACALSIIWFRPRPAFSTLAVLFAAHAWLAAILAGALILAPPKGSIWTMTLGSAFIIWIGFVLPAIVASYRLRGMAWRTIATDSSYWLIAMLLQAAVMRTIGLVPPPV